MRREEEKAQTGRRHLRDTQGRSWERENSDWEETPAGRTHRTGAKGTTTQQ